MTGERTTSWAPGRYRFTDYWRFGLPLSLVVLAAAIPMISQVWPAAG
jgi:di/tricarboxylate transporter